MTGHIIVCLVLALVGVRAGHAHARSDPCKVRMCTTTGPVCGLLRQAEDDVAYASFRGVPYAKAPTKEGRFKELEPLDTWDTVFATTEGPICYQTDVLYGRMMQPHGMSENCLYANIHVPINALPKTDRCAPPAIELEPPREAADESVEESRSRGLPILVFIHGGGFAFGSGDSDMHGPEYLVSKNVIVITFNYRLNVFGFLSLNSTQVPGNTGLRDMITLLQWVQRNARSFGGDPDNVTLGGQSVGAISAHLLTLSKAAEGLFKRAILMSGTAISSLYSPSPLFAKFIKNLLLAVLDIKATDPDEIYQQLIDLPAEKLVDANKKLLDQFGLTTFVPTVETSFPGVTPILDDYPENLLARGRGKDIPLLIGYTDAECETFRKRLEEFDIVKKSITNKPIIIPPKYLFTVPPNAIPDVAMKINKRYYNGKVTLDGFVQSCTESFFEYPFLKVVEEYEKINGPAVYAYKFSYRNDSSVLKTEGLKYDGAAHIEDMTYVFKTNSMVDIRKPDRNDSDSMKNFMTEFIVNFMSCSKPICDENDQLWSAANDKQFVYEDIHEPYKYQMMGLSARQQQLAKFFDNLAVVE
ncbi:unnamed protein product [Arctia plantaginis]|uniref:Carboxylesterase type B domain-containing protein n=1 Tax=Arctia plantaginis TaxID=874455 RepID=A0A8S1ASY1_ARCPL|nr:unnamed protein product [Arctia plantaginis]